MSKTFFAGQLDTAATWWRIHRRDGVTLGFATHDRDLWFDGVMHRAGAHRVSTTIRATLPVRSAMMRSAQTTSFGAATMLP